MAPSRRRFVPPLPVLVAFGLAPLVHAASCAVTPPLPSAYGDASAAADVLLPTLDLPDAFVVTETTADGGTTALGPSVTCMASDVSDAGDASHAGEPGGDGGIGDGDVADGADGATPTCPTAPAPGDLVFDEVMIASAVGTGDRGQWLEVENTRACAVDLSGLHAEAPHGQSFRTLDVATDVVVPPGGFFLIADSTDPTENNGLPGLVFAWAGSPADALHKTSDTVTLSMGGVTLDTLRYPTKKRAVGTSMAFPAGCQASSRADFGAWRPSTASWTAGFFGTPGGPNDDVTCAVPSIPTCVMAHRPPRPPH